MGVSLSSGFPSQQSGLLSVPFLFRTSVKLARLHLSLRAVYFDAVSLQSQNQADCKEQGARITMKELPEELRLVRVWMICNRNKATRVKLTPAETFIFGLVLIS